MFETLNYFEHFLIFTSAAFASLVGVSSSAVELKICEITAGIKKYESVIRKKKEEWSYSVVSKSNLIKVLISRDLIDLHINHDEFGSVNNVKRNMFYVMK